MISVRYWPREMRLTVVGHAMEETSDRPLICAAASMLVYALENAVDGMRKKKWVKSAYYAEEKGASYVYAPPRALKRRAVRVAFGMCYGGLAMLQRSYPKELDCQVATGTLFDDQKAQGEGGLSYARKIL